MILPSLIGLPEAYDAYGAAEPPAPRYSATSHAATSEIGPALNYLHLRLLDYLREQGKAGATGEEDTTPLAGTYRSRQVELVTEGIVRDLGRQSRCLSGRNVGVSSGSASTASKWKSLRDDRN